MIKNRITSKRSTSRRNKTKFSQTENPDVFLKHTIHHTDKIDIILIYCKSLLNPLSYYGHIYGIISKNVSGKIIKCSFSFYPENYKNILSMYTSSVFKQKGVIVFPDPILSKETRSLKKGESLVIKHLLETTVGIRLEKFLNRFKNKIKTSKYNFIIPTSYLYSILGKPILFNSNCYNCATFFSTMIKNLDCKGVVPTSCKKCLRSTIKQRSRSTIKQRSRSAQKQRSRSAQKQRSRSTQKQRSRSAQKSHY